MNDREAASSQRIDKWLWCARLFKTRSLAGKIVNDGRIRLTRHEQTLRLTKASFQVQPEDTLAFTKGRQVFIVKVLMCAERRGPAPEARTLYEDLSPPPLPKKDKPFRPALPFKREQGAGRPTKKERRALDLIQNPPTPKD